MRYVIIDLSKRIRRLHKCRVKHKLSDHSKRLNSTTKLKNQTMHLKTLWWIECLKKCFCQRKSDDKSKFFAILFQRMMLICHKHCNFFNIENSDMHLKCENVQTFRVFMKWNVDIFNIKSVHTLLSKYRKLQMLYVTILNRIEKKLDKMIKFRSVSLIAHCWYPAR